MNFNKNLVTQPSNLAGYLLLIVNWLANPGWLLPQARTHFSVVPLYSMVTL